MYYFVFSAQENCDESLLPAVYNLGLLLKESPNANGGFAMHQCPRVTRGNSPKVIEPKMESLVDIAARIVGKTCSSRYLEDHMSSLDEAVLCKVFLFIFACH